MGMSLLADAIQKASPEKPLSDAVHNKCKQELIRFILIGGMPEVVATYAQGGTLLECQKVLDDLTFSLYDDFSKYKARVPSSRLREVFASVIHQTGGKFTYAQASQDSNHWQIKESVSLLELAGIVYPVTHTSANGLPLAAEMNTKHRKYLIFDTGIYQRFLKLDLGQLLTVESLEQVNKGALAELFVGLELLKSAPSNSPILLYYWQREKAGSSAEVDYVVQYNADIVPVEVKSGTKGSMQSMFQFLSEKEYSYGIRCSMENFGTYQNIKVYPLYAVSRIGK
jgi:predicted AAA+ superfamily ATPase